MYYARIATDLMQVVNFSSLMQVCRQAYWPIKLNQVCKIQTRWNLILAFLKQLVSSLWIKGHDNQLASNLLTTWSRLVIMKLEQSYTVL